MDDLESTIQSSNIGAQDNGSLPRTAEPNNCLCQSLKQDIKATIDKKFADLKNDMNEENQVQTWQNQIFNFVISM